VCTHTRSAQLDEVPAPACCRTLTFDQGAECSSPLPEVAVWTCCNRGLRQAAVIIARACEAAGAEVDPGSSNTHCILAAHLRLHKRVGLREAVLARSAGRLVALAQRDACVNAISTRAELPGCCVATAEAIRGARLAGGTAQGWEGVIPGKHARHQGPIINTTETACVQVSHCDWGLLCCRVGQEDAGCFQVRLALRKLTAQQGWALAHAALLRGFNFGCQHTAEHAADIQRLCAEMSGVGVASGSALVNWAQSHLPQVVSRHAPVLPAAACYNVCVCYSSISS
jgi:hypothetical protein